MNPVFASGVLEGVLFSGVRTVADGAGVSRKTRIWTLSRKKEEEFPCGRKRRAKKKSEGRERE